MAKAESREKSIVRKLTVKRLHDEIHDRYSTESMLLVPAIKSGDLLKGINRDDIDRLQALFTSTIYPEVDARADRDKSFESLVKLLKAPQKLTSIIPSLAGIMLHHALIFPAAMRVGLNTVVAYSLSNRLEDQLVDGLMKIYTERGDKITASTKLSPQDYHDSYVTIPYAEGKRMINLAAAVMKAGKRKALVDASMEILCQVQEAMAHKDQNIERNGGKPQHPDDIAAIEYGKSVLKKVMDAFNYDSAETMDRMINISTIVELHYLNNMYGMNQ